MPGILRPVPDFKRRYPIRRALAAATLPPATSYDSAELRGLFERLLALTHTVRYLSKVATLDPLPDVDDAPFIVGLSQALDDEDWSAPDLSTALLWASARGVPTETLFHHVFATEKDPSLGHAAPGYFADRSRRILSPGAQATAHLLHAVGVAWAMRLRAARSVVVALARAEAASEPDLHHALNFSAVYRVPILFNIRLNLNQKWTDGAVTVAQKAAAYGLPAERVDGADPLAVLEAARNALELIRRGQGPALLEIVDTGKSESAASRTLRAWLTRLQAWDERHEASVLEQTDNILSHAKRRTQDVDLPRASTLLDEVGCDSSRS